MAGGGIGSPGLQTNDDEEITFKNNLHNISCSLGSSPAARRAWRWGRGASGGWRGANRSIN